MHRIAALLLTLFVVACASDEEAGVRPLPADLPPSTAEVTVHVGDNYFEPEALVVELGATVTWTWEGRAVHDVKGPGFHSKVVNSGTFAHTFDAPGAYDYVCTLHSGMEGVVYVTGGS